MDRNGRLTGVVLRRGAPQPGAFVTGGNKEILTDEAGRFNLLVRAGRYSAEARIFADDFVWEGNTPADVPAGGSADIVINLKEPSEWFREVTIWGVMNLKDEENFDDDEFATRTKLFRLFRVGAFYTHEEDGWTEKMGGEVRAELSIRIDWQMIDSSVNVACTLKLFEGTSEDTGDLDGQASQTFNVKRGEIDKPCPMFFVAGQEADDPRGGVRLPDEVQRALGEQVSAAGQIPPVHEPGEQHRTDHPDGEADDERERRPGRQRGPPLHQRDAKRGERPELRADDHRADDEDRLIEEDARCPRSSWRGP